MISNHVDIDKVLGKADFTKLLREKGVPEAEIEKGWEELRGLYIGRLLTKAYDLLPETVKEELWEGLDRGDNLVETNFPIVMEKVAKILRDNPQAIDMGKAIDATNDNFFDFYESYLNGKEVDSKNA